MSTPTLTGTRKQTKRMPEPRKKEKKRMWGKASDREAVPCLQGYLTLCYGDGARRALQKWPGPWQLRLARLRSQW